MDETLLWNVFEECLSLATDNIYVKQVENETDDMFTFVRRSKGDYITFRLEMFKIIGKCTNVARKNDKFMVKILMDIYEKEYLSYSVVNKKMMDLRDNHSEIMDHIDNEDGENEMEKVTEVDEEKEEDVDKSKTFRFKKIIIKTFQSVLEIFGHFTNPKRLHRETEVKQMYHDLLRGNNADLQKVAFKCILTYKYPFLKPYVEHFNNLITTDSFQDALLKFSIDESDSVIKEVDRPQVIPYLMMILRGQLLIHNLTVKRRNIIIFSYLAGLKSSELSIFIDEICCNLLEYFEIDSKSNDVNITMMCQKLSEKYDVSQTINLLELKRLVYGLKKLIY